MISSCIFCIYTVGVSLVLLISHDFKRTRKAEFSVLLEASETRKHLQQILILNGRRIQIMLTQSLVVVLRVARQSEQCRSHFLTALVQVLITQNTH